MPQPSVLIIEDEPDLARIFSLVFSAVGYQTDIAPNGKTALAWLKMVKPTVIVLDLHLPDILGQQILNHLYQANRLAETQVIIVTADLVMVRDLPAYTDKVLIKPIDIHQLKQLAQELQENSL